ncbi:Ribosome-associated heat shock protein implicated in the recycling of the 50S subunit (S4 paralog) [hydrothermal vent metagenome]|uniref:Ribosome-associated heat shock protein implicated in the recycling of the 50S subunit (S4 paralog) n=1 Tax=hydrothermal vent metagenome TaxID=652676 RepID=A0A3B0TNX7_9ZZZZ
MTRDSQRIDKWLWHARVFKTRSRAAAFAAAGKLRINGRRAAKASTSVGPDDVLTFALAGRVRVYRIAGLALRRGSYLDAIKLYEDLSPPEPQNDRSRRSSLPNLPQGREPGQGRPTKRERRALDRWNEAAR